MEEQVNETKENIEYIDKELENLTDKSSKSLNVFLLTVIAEILYILIVATGKYIFPFYDFPLIIGAIAGTVFYSKHKESKNLIEFVKGEKDIQKSELSNIHLEIKDVEKIKAQTKELLNDESNKRRLDDIVDLLERNAYFTEDVENEDNSKPKVKVIRLDC